MTTAPVAQRSDQDQPARAGPGFPAHRHHQRADWRRRPRWWRPSCPSSSDQPRNPPGGHAAAAAGGAAGRRSPRPPLRAPPRTQGDRRHLRRPGLPRRPRGQHARRSDDDRTELVDQLRGLLAGDGPSRRRAGPRAADRVRPRLPPQPCAASPATSPCCTPGKGSKGRSGCRSCSPATTAPSATWTSTEARRHRRRHRIRRPRRRRHRRAGTHGLGGRTTSSSPAPAPALDLPRAWPPRNVPGHQVTQRTLRRCRQGQPGASGDSAAPACHHDAVDSSRSTAPDPASTTFGRGGVKTQWR